MGKMKKQLEKIIETLESVTALHESINNLLTELKHFSDTMIHVRAELIKTHYNELKKYHYDPRFACEDKLFLAYPTQLMKEEIERILDEQDDALIYN